MDTATSAPQHCTIMVVDDDPTNLDMLADRLADARYSIIKARGGAQALLLSCDHPPQIIISDWRMPSMDGLDFCRAVRERDDGNYTYFIMLTVESDKERLLEAFDAGIDDFLTKPFNSGELLARVRAGERVVRLYEEQARRNAAAARDNARLAMLNAKLHRMAVTDELTGLYNRRHAMLELQEHWSLARRHGQPLACVMFDIDHFKQVNDSYGHVKGDEILQKVASVLRDCTRDCDIVCRMGGEEFLVIFPQQQAARALVCAERCRGETATRVRLDDGRPVTLSGGLAEMTPTMSGPDHLIHAADLCLYQAKADGRNRVVLSARQEPPRQQAG